MTNYPLVLYKRILRLHYGLPIDMRIVGDRYVKDEFRRNCSITGYDSSQHLGIYRHRKADAAHAQLFIDEWTRYCINLSKQLSHRGIVKGFIGESLSVDNLQHFADDQLHQLLELKTEAEKPVTNVNDR